MYLVPFQDKNRGMVAQFILGYKGYLELAMRSGQYKDINVMEIREGEYKGRNKENGNPTFEFIEDDDEREKKKIIGYMASFTLVNGFTKTIYKTQKQMEEHALQYSNGYRSDKKKGTAYTFWSKDFTSMAFKTLLRQLISRWGIMSIELQQAYDGDMAVINEDGTRDYVDNQAKDVSFEIVEQPKEMSLDEIE
jgi:recombination protein RecT